MAVPATNGKGIQCYAVDNDPLSKKLGASLTNPYSNIVPGGFAAGRVFGSFENGTKP